MQHTKPQLIIGIAAIVVAALLGWGATGIKSDAGYAGIGPNFVPWVVTIGLGLCGFFLILQALKGGYNNFPEPSGAPQADWFSFAWLAAGLLLNAALIERIGFILSCTLCYALAVRGLRRAEGKVQGGLRGAVIDGVVGFLLSAPVFWLFSKALRISLPGLTKTGWL
jgi:putative tricarboxylic transport membrane protein